ncbi:MAG: PAS domain S-box protein, partial [Bacteroidales bacterium]
VQEYNLRQENKRLLKELQRNNSIIQQAFNQIKEQQLKLFTIFEQSSDGIVVIRNNEVLEANPAFRKIFSISAEEKIIATCSRIMQENYPDFIEKLTQEAIAQNSFEYEITSMVNKRRYLEVRPNMIDFLGEKAILAVIRDITERREVEQKVLEAIIATQENEQRRYARELHDGIGPLLSTLKMYVEWIANPQTANTQEIINYALQTIDEAIRQAKTLSNQLSSHLLERYGLVQALGDFLEKTTNAFGLTYQFNAQLSSRLATSVETALYRILLEAVNNTLKYARANHISIELNHEKNRILVKYRDNGLGFDYNKTIQDSKGMGLFNIQNRVQALKGHCIINTRPGEGFEMQVYLPINE